MARATCGRPTAAPFDCRSTSEFERDAEPLKPGHLRRPRRTRSARQRSRKDSSSAESNGRKYPSTCISPHGAAELNSQPPTTGSRRARPRPRRGHAGHGVVIGECHGRETRPPRAFHDSFRRQAAVGRGRVNVQVEKAGRGRQVGCGQRRYPISGAVHEGCEWDSSSRRSWSLSWLSESSGSWRRAACSARRALPVRPCPG